MPSDRARRSRPTAPALCASELACPRASRIGSPLGGAVAQQDEAPWVFPERASTSLIDRFSVEDLGGRDVPLADHRIHGPVRPDRILPAGDEDLLALTQHAVRVDPIVARLLDPQEPRARLAL